MSSSEYESDYDDKYESVDKISTQNDDEIFEPIRNVNIHEHNANVINIRVTDPNNKKRKIYFLGLMCVVLKRGSIQFGQRIINHDDYKTGTVMFKFWQSTAKTLKPLILRSADCEVVFVEPRTVSGKDEIQDFSRPKFKNLFRDDDVIDPNLLILNLFQILPPKVVQKYRTYDYKENQHLICAAEEICTSRDSYQQPKVAICLGGKNSGKTTFNEMLYEQYMNTTTSITFMDLDPGQQRFGFPGCVSTAQFVRKALYHEYGDSLAPTDQTNIENHVIGSFDCMDYYSNYEKTALSMIVKESDFNRDVIVNMPGWLTGLGIQFIETVVNKFISLDKYDLKIVYLGDKESFVKQNIYIDVDYFIATNHAKYYAPGYRNSVMNTGLFFKQLNWTSGDIREYKLLRSLHDYDNNKSILNQQTFAVSMGKEIKNIRTIKITQYIDKTPSKTEEMTCFRTLPGSIVAISFFDYSADDDKEPLNASFFKQYPQTNEKMICLGVVHSVDVTNSYMNLIIPTRYKTMIDNLNTLDFKYGKIQTLAVGLPSYEFLPVDEDVLKQFNGQIPYTTNRELRKNEHTWKVRKNIQRKGQQ